MVRGGLVRFFFLSSVISLTSDAAKPHHCRHLNPIKTPTFIVSHNLQSISWGGNSSRYDLVTAIEVSGAGFINHLIYSADMAPQIKGKAIVLMGVSGAGKSTIGAMLAESFDCRFVDADDYHPQANKEKMKNGIPLSEDDRIPWLETLGDILKEGIMSNQILILGCSALQKRYREILRCADPCYELGSNDCVVKFVLLDAGAEVLAARLEKRAAEGKHFMPAKLLQSQIDLLQIDESEGILKVDATLDPHSIVDLIQASIVV